MKSRERGLGPYLHWEEEQIKGARDPRPIFRALTRASGLSRGRMVPGRHNYATLVKVWFGCSCPVLVQIDLISWEGKSGDQVIIPAPEHIPFMGNISRLRDALLSLQGSTLPGIGSNCRFKPNDERFPMPFGNCEQDLVKC